MHYHRLFSSPYRQDKFGFALYYEEFLVQNQEEYLVMDAGTLISTIGGFLGLFLGWSCLSIGEWFSHCFIKVF